MIELRVSRVPAGGELSRILTVVNSDRKPINHDTHSKESRVCHRGAVGVGRSSVILVEVGVETQPMLGA